MLEAFATLFCWMAGTLIAIALLWSLIRRFLTLEGVKCLFRLPQRMVREWPAWLRISRSTASALLAVVALLQTLYSSGSIFSLYQDLQANSFPPSLIEVVMKSLISTQFIQPILNLLLGLCLYACSIFRKNQPLMLAILALVTTLGGFLLRARGEGVHEMSHLVGEDCCSYPDTIGWFLSASAACCLILLIKPTVEHTKNPVLGE